MKPGDLAFSVNSNSWYGWLITTATKSRYSHVRLVVDKRGTTIEAMNGGVKYGKVGYSDVVLSPPLTKEQRDRVHDVAKQFLDIPYGWIDVVILGLAQVGIRLPYLTKKIEKPTRLFCSQLADLVLMLLGFQVFDDGRTHQNVSPGDLFDTGARNSWPNVNPRTRTKTSVNRRKAL